MDHSDQRLSRPPETDDRERRIASLEARLEELAEAHRARETELDAALAALEQAHAGLDGPFELAAPDPAGESFPDPVQAAPTSAAALKRLVLPPLRVARKVARRAKHLLRRVWQAADPAPAWSDRVEVVVGTRPARRVRLALLLVIEDGDLEPAARLLGRQRSDHAQQVVQVVWRRSDGRYRLGTGREEPIQGQCGPEELAQTIDCPYIWQLGAAEVASLPETASEAVEMRLETAPSQFLCIELPDHPHPTWVVARGLFRLDRGFDPQALAEIARADADPGVLGERLTLGPGTSDRPVRDGSIGGDSSPEQLRDDRGRLLVRCGRYWVASRPAPRIVRRTLAVPRHDAVAPPTAAPEVPTPGALLIVSAPLALGTEDLVIEIARRLAKHHRLAIVHAGAHHEPLGVLASRRWRALREITPLLYDCDTFEKALHRSVVARLASQLRVRTLVDVGGRMLETHGDAWRTDLPKTRTLSVRLGDGASVALEQDDPPPAVTRMRPAVAESVPAAPAPNDRETARRVLGARPDDVVVAWIGDLVASARAEDAVQLAARLRDEERLRFVISGDGPRLDAIEDLARLLPPARLVIRPTQLDRRSLQDAADLQLVTAERLPWPRDLRRAVDRDLPLVLTQGAWSALTGEPVGATTPEGEALVAPPVTAGDLDGFEHALRNLLEASDRHRQAARARARVQRFDHATPTLADPSIAALFDGPGGDAAS